MARGNPTTARSQPLEPSISAVHCEMDCLISWKSAPEFATGMAPGIIAPHPGGRSGSLLVEIGYITHEPGGFVGFEPLDAGAESP